MNVQNFVKLLLVSFYSSWRINKYDLNVYHDFTATHTYKST